MSRHDDYSTPECYELAIANAEYDRDYPPMRSAQEADGAAADEFYGRDDQ